MLTSNFDMRQATGRAVRYAAALLLLAVFLPTGTVLAACCKCQDPNNASQTICLKTTGACGNLKTLGATNPDVVGLTCQGELGEGECRLIEQGGLCGVLSDATGYSKTANSSGVIVPKLNADIGVAFTKANTAGGLVKSANIGEYISTIYKVSIGLATIAAAIMIVYGGFLYVLGGTLQSIQSGKQKIKNAIIGLILIFSSYTILNLVNPQLTGLSIISMLKGEAISDPTLAKKISDDFARKTISDEEEAAPEERAGKTIPPPTTPEAGGSPTQALTAAPLEGAAGTPPPTPQGAIATDPYGNRIYQNACPGEMVRIPYSEKYEQVTKKHVAPFCIDQYEAPNRKGEKPYIVNEWEAEWYCTSIGKRLCTNSEWVRTCLGPKAANTYGYGPKFIVGLWVTAGNDPDDPRWYATKKGGDKPAPCNYDTPAKGSPDWGKLAAYGPKIASESILNENNPKLSQVAYPKTGKTYGDLRKAALAEIDRLNGSETSGKRPDCMTDEGVFDMSGNVAEYTIKDNFFNMTSDQRIAKGQVTGAAKPWNWNGFYWAPITHQAETKAEPKCTFTAGGPHAAGSGWRDYANGFRCCVSLQE
ncbi:MAG: SUMF1/EgtB/PvdO family nonheme iron enzyme [Patescibacteria group bacterium]